MVFQVMNNQFNADGSKMLIVPLGPRKPGWVEVLMECSFLFGMTIFVDGCEAVSFIRDRFVSPYRLPRPFLKSGRLVPHEVWAHTFVRHAVRSNWFRMFEIEQSCCGRPGWYSHYIATFPLQKWRLRTFVFNAIRANRTAPIHVVCLYLQAAKLNDDFNAAFLSA
jgi:hypothetical protein